MTKKIAKKKLHVSAPGSLMLTGEHAVLRNYPALVAAVDKRIHVMLSTIEENHIAIESDKFGILNFPIDKLLVENFTPPFHFIGNVLTHFAEKINAGIKIQITSEFSPTVGLGSSAALTVALVYSLNSWFDAAIDNTQIALTARELIKKSQNNLGSGADVMASVFGGIVYYQIQPLIIELLPYLPPLVVVYSGNKTATPEVIAKVNAQEEKRP